MVLLEQKMLSSFVDWILLIIIIIWTTFACVVDIKKREVPNWISYSLLSIVMISKILLSIYSSNFTLLLLSLIGFFVFLLLGLAFYYGGVFGGGDVKLLMALGPFTCPGPSFAVNKFHVPFLLSFLFNLFLIGSLYGIIFSLGLALKNKRKFLVFYKKEKKTKIFYFLVALLIFIVALISKFYSFIFFALFLILLPYLFSFIKAAEKLMIKEKSWKELSEGDWLVEKVKIKNKIIKPSVHGLKKEEIELIKKAKKKVLIKDGIPFVPVILVALLLSVFFGSFFLPL